VPVAAHPSLVAQVVGDHLAVVCNPRPPRQKQLGLGLRPGRLPCVHLDDAALFGPAPEREICAAPAERSGSERPAPIRRAAYHGQRGSDREPPRSAVARRCAYPSDGL
jgi:hypothetical protein